MGTELPHGRRPTIQTLIESVNDIRRRCSLLSDGVVKDIEMRFGARYLLEMSNRVPIEDIAVFLGSSNERERGLVDLRAGNFGAGEKALALARELFSERPLCQEVRLGAESFQLPAEAYLQYRREQGALAQQSLLDAIATCQRLGQEYQHDVEVRRIHLARNIARVRSKGGDVVGALRMLRQLIGYINGHLDAWPLRDLCEGYIPGATSAELQWIQLDQILGDIAAITTREKATDDLFNELTETGMPRMQNTPVESAVSRWLIAHQAFIRCESERCIASAAVFFSISPKFHGNAWRTLTSEVNAICIEAGVPELAPVTILG
jgi:hypothetical protein